MDNGCHGLGDVIKLVEWYSSDDARLNAFEGTTCLIG